MNFRRSFGYLLITLLLLTQLSLAQHATVHFLEFGHAPAHQQGKDGIPAKDKLCQLCQLSHDYSKILTHAGPEFLLPVLADVDTLGFPRSAYLQNNSSPYAARAPPAFSARNITEPL